MSQTPLVFVLGLGTWQTGTRPELIRGLDIFPKASPAAGHSPQRSHFRMRTLSPLSAGSSSHQPRFSKGAEFLASLHASAPGHRRGAHRSDLHFQREHRGGVHLAGPRRRGCSGGVCCVPGCLSEHHSAGGGQRRHLHRG